MSYGSAAKSFTEFQHPSHELLKENNFVWHVYHKFHAKCLKGEKVSPPIANPVSICLRVGRLNLNNDRAFANPACNSDTGFFFFRKTPNFSLGGNKA